ncbi:MAG TPA: hypothetical protein VK982_00290 [Bacteroidales bacterium]|nr:hypothetical protein [Bacteroidales bacterium]
MMKKLLGLIVVTALIFSCGTQEKKEEKDIKAIPVDKIMADTENYINEEVVVKGMVNHVCAHGGKRMFILGEDPDIALRVTPDEKIGIFEKELEGNTVIIKGILKELIINDEYVAQLEKEIAEGMDNEALHDHSGGSHDEDEESAVDSSKIKQVEQMKTDIAESKKGFVAQYWIEASKIDVKEYEHIEEETDPCCDEEEHEHEENSH